MAVDSQTYVAESVVIPFSTNLVEPDRFRSSEPWGRLVHREAGGDDVVLDGSGAGDTARLRLEWDLPPGYVYRLLNARLTIYNTDVTQLDAYSEMYLLPGPPPNDVGNPTLVNWPLSQAFGSTSVANIETNSNWFLGNGHGVPGSAHGMSSTPPYDQLPLFYAGAGGDGMIWNIASSMDTQPAGTFSYWAEWLIYSVQQAEHSTLHWPVPVT